MGEPKAESERKEEREKVKRKYKLKVIQCRVKNRMNLEQRWGKKNNLKDWHGVIREQVTVALSAPARFIVPIEQSKGLP